MRTFASLSLLLAVVGFGSSQTIAPSSVPLSTRDAWCNDQITSCPLLCLQQANSASTISNSCNPSTLAWTCVCANGQTPSVANYSQTVPYFECTEWGTQCVAACGQDSACASNCRQEHPCGAQDPTRINTSTISTMSQTATGSGSASTSGGTFGGQGGSSGSGSGGNKSGAVSILELGQSMGMGVVAAAVFASFCILL